MTHIFSRQSEFWIGFLRRVQIDVFWRHVEGLDFCNIPEAPRFHWNGDGLFFLFCWVYFVSSFRLLVRVCFSFASDSWLAKMANNNIIIWIWVFQPRSHYNYELELFHQRLKQQISTWADSFSKNMMDLEYDDLNADSPEVPKNISILTNP